MTSSTNLAESARRQIRSELMPGERILWIGSPDPAAMFREARAAYWRSVLVLCTIMIAAGFLLHYLPPYSEFYLAGLSLAFAGRISHALRSERERHKRGEMGYALTDRRLVSVNGRTSELSSWFSPRIDQMRVRKSKYVATFSLSDPDIGVDMTLYNAPKPEELSRLLSPYVRKTGRKLDLKPVGPTTHRPT